jgi:hypothetical protein
MTVSSLFSGAFLAIGNGHLFWRKPVSEEEISW